MYEELLEKAIGAMLENGIIKYDAYSWCYGMVDMTITSEIFKGHSFIISVLEDKWDNGPSKAVSEELSRLAISGDLEFIPSFDEVRGEAEESESMRAPSSATIERKGEMDTDPMHVDREETIDQFTDEELLLMFKENLDELGIAYEEGPGDWEGFLHLSPSDFYEDDFYEE